MSKAARAALGITDGAGDLASAFVKETFLNKPAGVGEHAGELSEAWQQGKGGQAPLKSLVDRAAQIDAVARRGPAAADVPHARVTSRPSFGGHNL